jgi:hypothetical protein
VDLRICEIKIGNHPLCGPGRRGWGAERSSGATGASGIEASTTGRPVGKTRRLSRCSWDRLRDGTHVILACAVIVAFEALFCTAGWRDGSFPQSCEFYSVAANRGTDYYRTDKEAQSICDGSVGVVAGRFCRDLGTGRPVRIIERPSTPMTRGAKTGGFKCVW